MIENLDLGMVNWARGQFALTAMYHWIFVPLTLGLSWILAFYHTIYVRTGNEEWKRLTKFWMKLFMSTLRNIFYSNWGSLLTTAAYTGKEDDRSK